MIQIQQIKMPIRHTKEQLHEKICKLLKVDISSLKEVRIVKQSLDARKKRELQYVYTVFVEVENEQSIRKKIKNGTISFINEITYTFPKAAKNNGHRPVIVGSGPAGLFCAYVLAENGLSPIVIERGKMVDDRLHDVSKFWETGELNTGSNVQFGEGGAGTFSDGKLNTLVKDTKGRNKKVLDTFIKMGAPEKISYMNKPHIGTDILQNVVKNLREAVKEMGGTFYFETCVTDLVIQQGSIKKLLLSDSAAGKETELEVDKVVFAVGHSARDTFYMMHEKGIHMEAKAFAAGLRVEHPQKQIDINQYGEENIGFLPTADYKLHTKLKNERGVYSFCMCPGGYVVNASSEENMLAVNGMSYSKRDGKNANSAIIVTVTPEDFKTKHPLSGVEFQRKLEAAAFDLGNGCIPQQLFGDFIEKKVSTDYGEFQSCCKGKTTFAPLHHLFPAYLRDSLAEGMNLFAKYMKDFNRADCILSGVESRTSSPVRIVRDEHFVSNISGIYPCGEGAGYAGGIMSAAMDGLKVAEAMFRNEIKG